MKYRFLLFISMIISSCQTKQNTNGLININKAELLVPYLDSLDADNLILKKGEYLLIDNNYTYLYTDDSLDNNLKISETTHNEISSDLQTEKDIIFRKTLITLLIQSNCEHIIRDNDTYFFIENSWIDALSGIAYSRKTNINKNNFKFERVQEFEKIENTKNWYKFYAD